MSSGINELFNTLTTSVAYPIYYGLLGLVVVVALIFLIKDVIAAATSPQGTEQRGHIKQAGVVLIACCFLGFAPLLINWFISLSGAGIGGVDVG